MISLSSAELVALGGALGAAITKLFDFFLSKRKTDLDAANARLAAVNEANAQLTARLFSHIDRLEREVSDVKRALITCETQHHEAQAKLAKLEAQVTSLLPPDRKH